MGAVAEGQGRSGGSLTRSSKWALVVAVVWGLALIAAAVLAAARSSTSSETTSGPSGTTTSITRSTSTLVGHEGPSVLIPVSGPLVVACLVGGIHWHRARHGRQGAGVAAWTIASLLWIFNLLAMLSIGIFMLPVTAALMLACGTTRRSPVHR